MNAGSGAATTRPRGDRTAGILGWAFLTTLLVSEVVLTLPDETDSAAHVADFYAAHRATVIVVQLVGLLAAGLMAAFALRLRPVGRGLTVAGLLVAVAGLTPGSASGSPCSA
jgi:hypothetical protein